MNLHPMAPSMIYFMFGANFSFLIVSDSSVIKLLEISKVNRDAMFIC